VPYKKYVRLYVEIDLLIHSYNFIKYTERVTYSHPIAFRRSRWCNFL